MIGAPLATTRVPGAGVWARRRWPRSPAPSRSTFQAKPGLLERALGEDVGLAAHVGDDQNGCSAGSDAAGTGAGGVRRRRSKRERRRGEQRDTTTIAAIAGTRAKIPAVIPLSSAGRRHELKTP